MRRTGARRAASLLAVAAGLGARDVRGAPTLEPRPGATVTATEHPANIYERPKRSSMVLGYFRPGEHLSIRLDQELPSAGPCPGGWVAVAPVGFVCVGADGVEREDKDLPGSPLPVAPGDRLPAYWGSSTGSPRFRISGASNGALLASGAVATGVHLGLHAETSVAGVPYFVTHDGFFVPASHVLLDRPSTFAGVELGGESAGANALPLAWAKTTTAPLFLYENGALLPTDDAIAPHEHRRATGRTFIVGHDTYCELQADAGGVGGHDGGADPPASLVVRTADVSFIERATALPKGVSDGETWIDVAIKQQSLVVYEGLHPVFATLISSGKGGAAHYTPRGTFRVYQKHRTAEMVAAPRPEIGEEGYRFEEVPFVQYIVGGIALHAVYWHDDFGLARSHGCINLSPADAAWVFDHTLPSLPVSWHGVTRTQSGPGTPVVIR